MQFTRTITAVDAHAAGMHGRVVVGGVGVLNVPGRTMFEKKRHLEQHQDDFRKLMLREPRGNPAAMVNLVLPPTDPAAHAGVIIMEQSEYYPSMSGSNVMCVTTVLLECGIVPMTEPQTRLMLETPAGLVSAIADCRDGRVLGVTITNVPCFAPRLDVPLEIEGIGSVPIDMGYGGMFYAIADGARLGFRLTADEAADIVEIGERLRDAAREQIPVAHPDNAGDQSDRGNAVPRAATRFGQLEPQRRRCAVARAAQPAHARDSRPLSVRHRHVRATRHSPRSRAGAHRR
jgi:proline racemase